MLSDLGLKLNSLKTKISDDVIQSAIKNDKFYWNRQIQYVRGLQKRILIIYDLSKKYPNSGSLDISLQKYFRSLKRIKSINNNKVLPLISIVTNIAFENPRSYAPCAAILSEFLKFISDNEIRQIVIQKIIKKFDLIPNTGYLKIWLQRIFYNFDKNREYHEPLCNLVIGNNQPKIWFSEWLKEEFKNLLSSISIVDYNLLENLSDTISVEEVEVFSEYDS